MKGSKERKTKRGAGLEEFRLIKSETGADYLQRYKGMCEQGKIDPEDWPRDEFAGWILRQRRAGADVKNTHVHRIDAALPLKEENAYLSYRQEGSSTHGMSGTRIYKRYIDWKAYYRERLTEEVDFIGFFLQVLSLGYDLSQSVRTDTRRYYVGLEDLYLKEREMKEDFDLLLKTYRDIPENLNGFGDFKAFAVWSVCSGFREGLELRKVKDGKYSRETCAWDIFTPASKAERKKSWNRPSKSPHAGDKLYERWHRMAKIGRSGGWETFEGFKKWAEENNAGQKRILRLDKSKMFSPENVRLADSLAA